MMLTRFVFPSRRRHRSHWAILPGRRVLEDYSGGGLLTLPGPVPEAARVRHWVLDTCWQVEDYVGAWAAAGKSLEETGVEVERLLAVGRSSPPVVLILKRGSWMLCALFVTVLK